MLLALPCLILIGTLLFFAWRMGRTIRQPVDELMLAVQKIRQHDLNFTIEYSGRNELGDLCEAFSKLRHELQESLEREWEKQEEMRTMIAALSHDLRAPVTIIQGHIESLRRSEEGEKRSQRLERYLPVLEASSQRMSRLLNEILLVCSLEQTSFMIQPQPVLLEEEMERKAQMYRLQAAAHQIEFFFTCRNPADHRGPVVLDLHRMEQVLDNLFENALRYTSAQGSISLICMCSAGSFSFLLRDTGCGIAPEDLPHVFEKFYHGRSQPDDNARKAVGLGLYTCKLLVEKCGGTITIQNCPTGGCEVAVSVPTR
ncbi:MAG TPA: HAMP domain-containing sensor histidine kinase [Ktedonobacteraceae bacterium]|nr:HAMP domain-containing sensor histidine kinase [Ktedonobacteraceae bacterium]